MVFDRMEFLYTKSFQQYIDTIFRQKRHALSRSHGRQTLRRGKAGGSRSVDLCYLHFAAPFGRFAGAVCYRTGIKKRPPPIRNTHKRIVETTPFKRKKTICSAPLKIQKIAIEIRINAPSFVPRKSG